ncbi:IclR family transcriptional regulator domain-containing protein [Halobellus sp. GM3]|uniref:IclR family transcriptional regulator domain-containing protein n=1 Tax=Halobellus sp. GM3 TaxID=3458410 RepID=UPI00403D93A0
MVVDSVKLAFSILGFVRSENGAGVSAVADRFDIPTSTAYDHLSTLYELEYVTKEDSQYKLGLNAFHLGSGAKASTQISSSGLEIADRLADQTGENVLLVAEEFGFAFYLHRSIGEYGIETRNFLGDKQFLHCTASGKAILANLPADRVEEIIERHGLCERTEHTITDRDELLEALDNVRNQEYALSNQETAIGTAGIAAPVIVDNYVYGAIAVTGPTKRIWREETKQNIIKAVLEASNEIQLRIMYQ